MRSTVVCVLVLFLGFSTWGQDQGNLSGQKVDGYKGIWFELNQKFPYGDKYSGGLGTYTAKHIPLAIYAPQVNKTFFVYGGTRGVDERYLLCMIGAFDHDKRTVSRPLVVHDKEGVDDPHDDPSLSIDDQGYLWVFVSGRGTKRPGFIYKSLSPYDESAFERVEEGEFTYPQPWYVPGMGFMHLFTKYSGVRELYYRMSPDGMKWTADRKLAGMKEAGKDRSGHYQVSQRFGNKISTFCNRHPDGNVDQRTDLYYMQTTDFGKTWTNINGIPLMLPLEEVVNPARVLDYQTQGKNVYLKDLKFDDNGNPMCLYITSGGHEPGPENSPREWRLSYWTGKAWQHSKITESDHNYDMGSLFIKGKDWYVVAPTTDGPQFHGAGGEIDIWQSKNKGKKWKHIRDVTKASKLNHGYVRHVLHGVAPFEYFWADGDPDIMSTSHLYFGDLEGNVWQLPYDMSSESASPKKINCTN